MSVNSLILLPPDVRIHDVAMVIGILSGLKPHKQMLSGGGYACHVDGAKADSCQNMPEMSTITVTGDLIDGETNHYTTWHWEPDNNTKGERLLYPKANAFWIAVGRRLVDFFGGSIVYCDFDNKVNYSAKKPRRRNNPSDGDQWHAFQDEMLVLNPLTQSELEAANELSAYKMERITT